MKRPFSGSLVLIATLALLLSSASSVRSTPSYEVLAIGPLIPGATSGTATAVNEGGDVAGYVAFQSSWEHTGFVHTAELGPILLPRPAWAVTARALDLSDRDAAGAIDVVGWAANSIYSGDLAVAWRVSAVDGSVEMFELGTLPDLVQSQAKAVNDIGDRVGYSGGFMQFGGPATLFAPDGPEQIGSLYTAVAVNESRVVLAGQGWESSRFDLDTGVQEDLGRPAGSFNGAIGMAMNDFGQVAAQVLTGDTDPRGQFIKQVWRFTDGIGWEYLFGGNNALDTAFGINNGGDVVGKILVGLTHVDILYLEESGAAYQIETLFAEGYENVEVDGLNDINDARQIATSGPGGPLLLTPAAATSVDGVPGAVATSSAPGLSNSPNPFHSSTTIRYSVPIPSEVSLRVYDVAGRVVRNLVHRADQAAGGHSVVWDGRDDSDRDVSAGVYFYRLDIARVSETRRMMLVK